MTQCKAFIDAFPKQQCSRKPKAGSQYCAQHDPKSRVAKRKDEYLRREWLLDLREARGTLSEVRRDVCHAAKHWALGRTGGGRPYGAGDALVKHVERLKEAEDAVEALLERGRAEKWTKL